MYDWRLHGVCSLEQSLGNSTLFLYTDYNNVGHGSADRDSLHDIPQFFVLAPEVFVAWRSR